MRLAIVSQSARIIAQAAHAEGMQVYVVDGFGDIDTLAAAHVCVVQPALCDESHASGLQISLKQLLIEQLDAWAADIVLIGSGFEAEIENYAGMYQRYCVAGNPPAVIEQVKNPRWLTAFCQQYAMPMPEICFDRPTSGVWLHKRIGGCGGGHIQICHSGHPLAAKQIESSRHQGYFQAWQAGQAVGALFVANHSDYCLIGVHALQHRPDNFQYAGASVMHDASMTEAIHALLKPLVAETGLVGINSVDALWFEGRLYLLEVNPRLSASMRLYAQHGLIQVHIDSCLHRQLPSLPKAAKQAHAQHVVCYAKQPLDVSQLVFPAWVEDQPAGGMVDAGQPLFSLFAHGHDAQAVQQQLLQKQTILEEQWGQYVCEHIEFNIH